MDFRHSISVGFPNSSDFRHSISVGFPDSSDFRHCVKSEPKVQFSDTFFKMCLKSKPNFKHLRQCLNENLRQGCLKSELTKVQFKTSLYFRKDWISDIHCTTVFEFRTSRCLKSKLSGNRTQLNCLKSKLVLILDVHCTVNIQTPDKFDFGQVQSVWLRLELELRLARQTPV